MDKTGLSEHQLVFAVENSAGSAHIVSMVDSDGHKSGYLVGGCETPQEALSLAAQHWSNKHPASEEASVVFHGPGLLDPELARSAIRMWLNQADSNT